MSEIINGPYGDFNDWKRTCDTLQRDHRYLGGDNRWRVYSAKVANSSWKHSFR